MFIFDLSIHIVRRFALIVCANSLDYVTYIFCPICAVQKHDHQKEKGLSVEMVILLK